MTEQSFKPTAFEFVAHGPGAWGRGGTLSEAIANMRKSLTAGTKTQRYRNSIQMPYYVYASDKPIEVEVRDGGLRVRPQEGAKHFAKFDVPDHIEVHSSAIQAERIILDALWMEHTAFPSLRSCINTAEHGHRPSMDMRDPLAVWLADDFDAAREAFGSPIRVYRYGTAENPTLTSDL